MNTDMIQVVIDLVFSKFLVWLAPVLFLFCTVLFADRLIDLVFDSVVKKRRYR